MLFFHLNLIYRNILFLPYWCKPCRVDWLQICFYFLWGKSSCVALACIYSPIPCIKHILHVFNNSFLWCTCPWICDFANNVLKLAISLDNNCRFEIFSIERKSYISCILVFFYILLLGKSRWILCSFGRR